jgi:hypothetical protein
VGTHLGGILPNRDWDKLHRLYYLWAGRYTTTPVVTSFPLERSACLGRSFRASWESLGDDEIFVTSFRELVSISVLNELVGKVGCFELLRGPAI